MKKKLAVSVVTPIFNDVLTIEQVLLSLDAILAKRKIPYEIVCIDDCSSDGSLTVARRLAKSIPALRIFSHTINMGIAYTYRELYKHARGGRVVLFSLDGEWDPHDVERLLNKKEDIVIGCRVHKQYSLWRSFVSYTYNVLMRVLFGVSTRDAGSIKVFSREVLATIPILSAGVFDEAERLIRAVKKGYTLGYVPITHFKKVKKKRGIQFRHVAEAVVDMFRVYFSV